MALARKSCPMGYSWVSDWGRVQGSQACKRGRRSRKNEHYSGLGQVRPSLLRYFNLFANPFCSSLSPQPITQLGPRLFGIKLRHHVPQDPNCAFQAFAGGASMRNWRAPRLRIRRCTDSAWWSKPAGGLTKVCWCERRAWGAGAEYGPCHQKAAIQFAPRFFLRALASLIIGRKGLALGAAGGRLGAFRCLLPAGGPAGILRRCQAGRQG